MMLQIKPSDASEAESIAKEYQDFAYIVSHDLNAPLRHVKEFTRLLIGSRPGSLNDQEKEYIQFLEKSLGKLDDMQEALLAFSRLNTRFGVLTKSDCNKLVAEALKDLDPVISQHFPAVECGNLPNLNVEPRQFQMLFYYLIDNALKFHEKGAKRKLHIGVKDQDDSYLFEIRDNGIGIAPEYHEEVFKMFRRLNPDQYPGIGAGLTLAQKIVHKHGGEILIESEPEKGTSVFFSVLK